MEIESINSLTLWGGKVIDIADFMGLLFRFILNTGVLLILIRRIYLKYSTRSSYAFSFLAVGEIIFLLCYLLSSVRLELGFALGLFAVFGIIRYRTDAVPFKQMTYLFVVIGISVINALACALISHVEILFANCAVLIGVWIMERYLSHRHEGSMVVVYENISNINRERYDLLISDLKDRTGFAITHFEIESIDYLKDVATITIYFNANDNGYHIDAGDGK